MNITERKKLDKKILKEILAEEQSIYGVYSNIKGSNYATVWRHVNKMKKDNLITVIQARRKNGKPDQRKTEILKLTNKGLATLLIEYDLQEKESVTVGKKFFLKYFNKKLLKLINPVMANIFSNAMMKIKPKVNLKFFDEKIFDEVFVTSFIESLIEILPKTRLKLEPEQLRELLDYSRKMSRKQGFSQSFEKGLDFGKRLRSRKEKEE